MLSYDARAKTAMDGVRGLDMYGAVVARNAGERKITIRKYAWTRQVR